MAYNVWDPFRGGLSLWDAMDQLIEGSFVHPGGWTDAVYPMPLDVSETPDTFWVKAALPGFNPEDINVSVTGDTLTIHAEHKGQEEQKDRTYLLRERRFGTVNRSITLPTRVQADQVQAQYVNGELILSLPKAEDVKPRQISISTRGQGQLAGNTESGGSQKAA